MKHFQAPTNNYLEACPPEICALILTHACTDDGHTGRALSLVSRRIQDLSREVKLRSLSVVGGKQLVGCAEMLGNLAPRFRRVRHVYLSGLGPFEKPIDVMLSSIPNQNYITNNYRAFERILQLISPTLITLTLISNIPRPTPLLPVPLPALQQMTVWGMLPTRPGKTTHLAMFPSLRELSFIGFDEHPSDLFIDVDRAAPALTHLTLAPMQFKRPLFDDLASILGADGLLRSRPKCILDHATARYSAPPVNSTDLLWNWNDPDVPSNPSSGTTPSSSLPSPTTPIPDVHPCPCFTPNPFKHLKTINLQRLTVKSSRHNESALVADKQFQALSCRDARIKLLPPSRICPYSETKREWLMSKCMYI